MPFFAASSISEMTFVTPPSRSSHAGSACTAPTLTVFDMLSVSLVLDDFASDVSMSTSDEWELSDIVLDDFR